MKRLAFLALAPAILSAKPQVIDDVALIKSFRQGVGDIADAGEHPDAKKLSKQLKKAPAAVVSPALPTDGPSNLSDGVYLIGSVYKCGKCDDWHTSAIATAWALTPDGLMATNHHVFEKLQGAAVGVCDSGGNVLPVTRIVATSKHEDVTLFRVEGENLAALPLGPDADVGSRVRVISHPKRRFFMQTSGEVSRYHRRAVAKDAPLVAWMSITADFAVGSSGAPVLNDQGQVVGVVSSTRSLYYNSDDKKDKGPLQMVVKNCVPVAAIRDLLSADAETSVTPDKPAELLPQ